ncbi:MAG: ankyrin repeat domain-containing protein [Pseudomonadota bacterium]
MLLIAVAGMGHAGSSPLMRALHAGDHERLALVLRQGADPDARQADGSLPLAWAIDRQDTTAVRILLEAGADPDDPAPQGNAFRPLFVACLHPTPVILDALLDAGADVRVRGPDGLPVLAPCAARAPLPILQRMLRQGADPNVADSRGQTALMWAAQHARIDSFDALLQAGARLEQRSTGGWTAMMFAVKSGSAAMARRVRDAGGDLAERAPEDTTLVQLAMYQGNYDFAGDLIDAGADLNAYDRNGRQLLHAAVMADQPALVAKLLAAGADPQPFTTASRVPWRFESNFKAGTYEFPRASALLLAAKRGNRAIMRALLDAGADPLAVTSDGDHLILAAVAGGEPDALALALERLDRVNVPNTAGETALHRALRGAADPRFEVMLGLLADHGARTDLANGAGKTARELALDVHFKGRDAFTRVFETGSGIAAEVGP